MTLKALYLNTSLKTSDDKSNTSGLIQESAKILENEGVKTEEIRAADYNIPFGMEPDMGEGDEWPKLFEKIKEADIFVIGSPVWEGQLSSITKLVLEKLDASSSETNDKGQPVYYNTVAGAIVTGNEDGGKQTAMPVIFVLQHLGFTIPPNAEAYWVGEAGPGPSYLEAGQDSEFTQKNVTMMSHNLVHMSRILKENPIPAKGNTQ
ncbi:flavodoxin family protein [Salipaludibacillus aurantiacus]|uniref:Multimeric flavodoxin WrbA n=1 Tax=Salipaludibacillus aurantiacus TaxID=1601833 RepID=A0A1H9VTP6_9BACI|nr:flavodoxin family protein [Salipaludibacillus aurantiacus]SES25096.1 Multimeric flavodoxin WrbA [Salipaludibacillus aurantiacus]